MLNDNNKLFFPKILVNRVINLYENPKTKNDNYIDLYYLDWSRKIRKCGDIETEFDMYIDNSVFYIPDDHLYEIRRTSRESINEWNLNRNLSTSLKNIYLKPAIKYIECAFELLSENLFDLSTYEYDNKINRIFMFYMLLFRFWKNQVSNDVLIKIVRKDKLIRKIDEYGFNDEAENAELIIKFIDNFDNIRV